MGRCWGETALSLIGDIGTVFGVGAAVKGLSAANKARKFYKTARASEKSLDALDKATDASKLRTKIKHNDNVIHSLGVNPQNGKGPVIINQRIKNNQILNKQLNTYTTQRERLFTNIKDAYKQYDIQNNKPYFKQSLIAIPGKVGVEIGKSTLQNKQQKLNKYE